jgi:FkbM family methyltransferase
MKRQLTLGRLLREMWHKILLQFWLRRGQPRASFMGPYRGLTFRYVPQMHSFDMLKVYYAAFEPEVTTWLTQNIQPGMSVLVAGGFTGVHVLHIARLLQGQGRMDVFEGWPENYAVMLDHLQLNRAQINMDLIHAHPLCLAETEGTTVMVPGPDDSSNHLAWTDDAQAGGQEIAAISVDAFWETTGDCFDLVILDVEGWELPILRGSRQVLAACRPTLIIEHHNMPEVAPWLQNNNYSVQPLGKRHLLGQPSR